jgi:hypothetical protein
MRNASKRWYPDTVLNLILLYYLLSVVGRFLKPAVGGLFSLYDDI